MVNLKSNKLLDVCKKSILDTPFTKFLIAYSGGIDSSVLLHCFNKLSTDNKITLRSIHINHNLSDSAKSYKDHCKKISDEYKFEHLSFDIKINSKSNIEEQCRIKRYEKITKECKNDEVIVTAHHLDDQIETFFLRLLRGSASRGLSGIKHLSMMNKKYILRPLLDCPKSLIKEYQNINNISYVEDKSNKDDKYDRNFLRNKVLPLLKTRWASLDKNISNNINALHIQSQFLDNHISELLHKYSNKNETQISIDLLNTKENYLKILIIHEWVYKFNGTILNLKQINEIIKIMKTNNDSNPLFVFNNTSITKDRDILLIKSTKK
jgi:tRNA(Ile)-lysidine synthase